MKRGSGAPDVNPPGRRRSKRGAALLAAAATGEASSSGAVVQSGSSTSGRSSSYAAGGGGAGRQARARTTATPRARSSGADVAMGTRSSPRRQKKATRESPAAAAASAALRETSSAGAPTAVSRGATAKDDGKRTATLSASTETSAAASAATAPSSSLYAAAATPGSKKRRSNGGGGGGGSGSRGDVADSDAAMEMLATLMSPVAAAREDARAQAGQAQEGGRERSATAHRQEEYTNGVGGGGEEDPNTCPLEAMFLALEQVLPLFRRRRQASLLKQVRPAVEGMCGRSFTRQHLARIVYVQPDAYKLSSKTDARPTRGGYRLRDLLIEIGPSPTLEAGDGECDATPGGRREGETGGKDESAPRSRGGRSSSAIDGSRGSKTASGEAASARRREVFRRLLSSAKSRHCKCGGGVRSGNPTANGQQECSCLPEAPLPDTSPVPVDGVGGGGGGGGGDSQGLSADESVAGPSSRSLSLLSTPEAQGRGKGTVCGGVDYDVGGSDAPKSVESLRERLRQKDAQRQLSHAANAIASGKASNDTPPLRTPGMPHHDGTSAKERNKSVLEKEADRRRKGNLPAMADAVRSYFAHSGRTTCSLDALVEALSNSSKHALSPKEARDRVRMISDLVPEWCTIIAPPAATGGSGGGGRSGGGDGGRGIPGGVDEGMVARPTKAREVVRVNARIRFDEVRQMIAFMAEGGGGGGGGGGKS